MAANLMGRFFGMVGLQTAESSEDEWNDAGATATPRDTRSTFNVHAAGNFRVSVYCPDHADDVTRIANSLLQKDAVLVNFQQVAPVAQRQMSDFLQGVLCVNGGQSTEISQKVILFAPLMLDVIRETKRSGSDDLLSFLFAKN